MDQAMQQAQQQTPLDPLRFPVPLLQAIGFAELLAQDGKAGMARVAYLARPEFTHSGGEVVQGGFVSAWLDNAMAFAVHARDPLASAATLEMKISFLDRATVGRYEAVARILRWGRSVAFLEAELLGAGGCVARASSTLKLRHASG